MDITIKLTRDEWLTVVRTMWRGIAAYSEDMSFIVKAQIAMDLTPDEMSITRPRIAKVDAREKEARRVTQKIHEMMGNQFAKELREE